MKADWNAEVEAMEAREEPNWTPKGDDEDECCRKVELKMTGIGRATMG